MVRIKPLDTLAQRRRSGDRLTCLLRPHHGTDSAPIPNRSMTPDPGAATPTQLRISSKPDPNDRRWPGALKRPQAGTLPAGWPWPRGRHQQFRFALRHPSEPRALGLAASDGALNNRHRPANQKPSDIALSDLRHPAEPLLAPGRMLSGNKAQPGREVATAAERAQVGGEALDRHGGDRADPGHGPQTGQGIAGMRRVSQPFLELGDTGVLVVDLLHVEPTGLAGGGRHRDLGVIGDHRQSFQVRNPLRGDNSVLGEMPPQGVDGLGALANQHVAGPEELSIAAPSV